MSLYEAHFRYVFTFNPQDQNQFQTRRLAGTYNYVEAPFCSGCGIAYPNGLHGDLLASASAADMIGKEAWVDLGPGSGEPTKGGNFFS